MKTNKFMKAAIKEAYKGINKHEGGPFGRLLSKMARLLDADIIKFF